MTATDATDATETNNPLKRRALKLFQQIQDLVGLARPGSSPGFGTMGKVTAGASQKPPVTLKYPSDQDEPVTMKFPSDGDDTDPGSIF